MRKINLIVLHCTASSQDWTVPGLISYFRDVKKWRAPGYHIVITPDGEPHNIWPLDKVANGAAGHNANTIHVCYFGGILKNGQPVDNRTVFQKKTMLKIVTELLKAHPKAKLAGHNQLAAKACPSFSVPDWAEKEGIKKTRLYESS